MRTASRTWGLGLTTNPHHRMRDITLPCLNFRLTFEIRVSGHHSPRNVQFAQGSTPPMIADPNTGSGPPIVFEPPEVLTEANPIAQASGGGIDEHIQGSPAAHGGLMAETREEPTVISNKQGPSGSSSSSRSTSNSSNANSRGKI